MPKPIVIAYHLMWTAYGCWMPNDPRGSTSKKIANDVIAELGKLHYGRKKVQPSLHEIREFQHRAKEVLKYAVKKLNSKEVAAIADGFAEAITEHRYTCYACVIMPDHVHILIRKHKHQAEDMIENLQNSSRLRLSSLDMRNADHPVWAEGGWKVFLDHPDAIRRTIHYIEENPIKWKLPTQQWNFVKEYDGWPLHPGHSPNSPYAKQLRGYKC